MSSVAAPVLGEIGLEALARIAANKRHAAGRPWYSDPEWVDSELVLCGPPLTADLLVEPPAVPALDGVAHLDIKIHPAGEAGDLTFLEAS